MAANLWMFLLSALVVHNLPAPAAAGGGDPFAAMANLAAIFTLATLAAATGVLALWALMITGPLWVAAEVIAWLERRGGTEPGGAELLARGEERVKHGWIPR